MSTPSSDSNFPRAMRPPTEPVVAIDSSLIGPAIEASRKSPRGRVILPLHKDSNDNLQRMLNALQPNSYIQPHRHSSPPKAESIIVLKGAIGFVTFKENGEVDQNFTLAAGSPEAGIDTDPDVYHTFFALEDDTVLFEVKPGPYKPDTDKDFAIWAPDEGSGEVEGYLKSLYKLVEETV